MRACGVETEILQLLIAVSTYSTCPTLRTDVLHSRQSSCTVLHPGRLFARDSFLLRVDPGTLLMSGPAMGTAAGFHVQSSRCLLHSGKSMLLACVLLLLSCMVCNCQQGLQQTSAESRVLFGQLQAIILHDREEGTYSKASRRLHAEAAQLQQQQQHIHVMDYFLRLRSGEMIKLAFPQRPKQMPRTGAYVMVRAAPNSRCNSSTPNDAGALSASSSTTLCVSSMMAQEAAPRDMFAAGQPRGQYSFKALVMQLQVCGKGPATTPDKLEAALFEGLPSSQAQTLQGAFKACSYGNADFSKASGVQVVTVTVPIPCKGTTPWNLAYDSSTCPYVEWSDVANDYVRNLGINWDQFKHKVYVVPPGDLCSWGGMGYVGCAQDCRAWISGDLWQYPTTWLHELGHNLYMNHAGSYQDTGGGSLQFVSYKDDSGAMGHCCSMRCFNAPHSYQVGWSKPLAVLHKDNMPAGAWQTYVLPPRQGAASSDLNMLRLLGDWNAASAAYNLYLEFRAAQGFDSGLLDTVKDKVTLYSTALGDAMPFTTLEAAVGPNQMLRESRLGSQLTVWVGSRVGDAIRVHVCRPEAATETDCGDGKDNDCDGYTDAEDTDCKVGPTPSRRLFGSLPSFMAGNPFFLKQTAALDQGPGY